MSECNIIVLRCGIQANGVTTENVKAACKPVDQVVCENGERPVRLPDRCCATNCMWNEICICTLALFNLITSLWSIWNVGLRYIYMIECWCVFVVLHGY